MARLEITINPFSFRKVRDKCCRKPLKQPGKVSQAVSFSAVDPCGTAAEQHGISATFQTFHGSINDTENFLGGNVSKVAFSHRRQPRKIQNVARYNLRALFAHIYDPNYVFKTPRSLTLELEKRKTKQEKKTCRALT